MKFLLFRLPQKKDFFWIENQGTDQELASFFSFTKEKKLSLFSDKMQVLDKENIKEKLSLIKNFSAPQDIKSPTETEYLEKVKWAIAELGKNHWQKLVLSRPVKISLGDDWDLAEIFFDFCDNFSQAFCYIWKDENCLWIGATPELLGKFDRKKSTFETMSLAGTLPTDEEWTTKEIAEQQAVTDYIASMLKIYTDEVEMGKVENHNLGKIKHLRTDFLAKIDEEKLESLIQDLHPTPAVCGIPKMECLQKISEIENYDRDFYAGYIRVEMEKEIYFFVNLRCMQVFDNKLIAYVGGGVNSQSIPEKEWQETEMKLNSILGNIKKRLNI